MICMYSEPYFGERGFGIIENLMIFFVFFNEYRFVSIHRVWSYFLNLENSIDFGCFFEWIIWIYELNWLNWIDRFEWSNLNGPFWRVGRICAFPGCNFARSESRDSRQIWSDWGGPPFWSILGVSGFGGILVDSMDSMDLVDSMDSMDSMDFIEIDWLIGLIEWIEFDFEFEFEVWIYWLMIDDWWLMIDDDDWVWIWIWIWILWMFFVGFVFVNFIFHWSLWWMFESYSIV